MTLVWTEFLEALREYIDRAIESKIAENTPDDPGLIEWNAANAAWQKVLDGGKKPLDRG